jgi:hypothetical protein
MEQVSSQGPGERAGIRGVWLQLTLEAVVFTGIGVLLAVLARQLPGARADAGVVFAMLLVLHGCGVVRFAREAAEFFELECPHCAESFHGLPDRLPRPFRTHCARCGVRA